MQDTTFPAVTQAATPSAPPSTSVGTPPPADVLSMLRRNAFGVLLLAILGAAAAAGAGILLPPKYKATTQLYVDPRDLQVLDKQVTPQTEAQNIGTTLVETQALVLRSDDILRRVIARLELASDPEFNGTLRTPVHDVIDRAKSMAGIALRPPPGELERQDATLSNLRKAIDVYRLDRTYVLQAAATARSRDTASAILAAMVATFLEYQSTTRAEIASRTSAELGTGIARLKSEVERLEQGIAQFKAANDLAGLVGVRGLIVSEQQLSDLNTQFTATRVEASRLEARLKAMPKSAIDLHAVPEAVASQTLRELRGLMARVTQRKAELDAQFLPGHPVMRSVNDRLRQIRGDIAAELGRIRGSITMEYTRAKDTERALEAKLQEQRERLNKANQAQITLREMERRLDAARTVYAQAIKRGREAGEQSRLNTANIRVISEPHALQDRISPPPLPLLASAGFVLGLVTAFLLLHLTALLRSRGSR